MATAPRPKIAAFKDAVRAYQELREKVKRLHHLCCDYVSHPERVDAEAAQHSLRAMEAHAKLRKTYHTLMRTGRDEQFYCHEMRWLASNPP